MDNNIKMTNEELEILAELLFDKLMEVIISYRSWYTLVDRWICPTIQNGIARFWLIHIVVNFINRFIPRKARTL